MTNVQTKTGRISYESLSDKATETLRDAIVRGDYPPGAKLTEESCAQEMGVSRACIREAFITLESEWLVHRKRNKYTEVEQVSERDAQDVAELRAAIEVLSIRKCIAQNSVPVDELVALAKKIARLNKKHDPDIRELVEADFEFHESILRAAGNRKSLAVWSLLKGQMKMLQFKALDGRQAAQLPEYSNDHEAIIKAMANRDFKEASALARQHVARSAGPARTRITHRLEDVGLGAGRPPTTRFPFSTHPGQ